MNANVGIDTKTGRKFFLDMPEEHRPGEPLLLLLNLHGGGSHGVWQREYFPAYEYRDKYRLVVATPSAATREPMSHWAKDADDEHLRNVVELAIEKIGPRNLRGFWLVGHSQGGMTSNRLLRTDFFRDKVDGWLSLSGGRIGPVEIPKSFFVMRPDGQPPKLPRLPGLEGMRPGATTELDADISFIFATGEHEIVALPETSPWAEKYGAGPRVRMPDVVDDKPGYVYDTLRDGKSSPAWGLRPRPGTAQVYVYPNARGGRVIADVVRIDKGHTEGLEPKITETLVRMIAEAPGGKVRDAAG